MLQRSTLIYSFFVLVSWGLPAVAQVPLAPLPDERNFPAQYFTKLYTESLGRGPDQSAWRWGINYFGSTGCNPSSLAATGRSILQSGEFNGLGYDNAAKLLVAYRMILNREPEAGPYNQWLNWLETSGGSFAAVIDNFYASAEFQTLAKTICDPKTPGYSFGSSLAIDIPLRGTGFSGDAATLQATLNAAPPGSTIMLAPRAVIRLNQPLVVPPGVNLVTTGMPLPSRYAEMARLVRVGDWNGPMVDLLPGAKLYSVWVDGQRGNLPNRFERSRINIRMLSGEQTTVGYSRVGNSRGATAIELYGQVTGQRCVQNWVVGNLIEAYASSHYGDTWSDGVSVACENANVAYNTVIDATDVPLILFSVNPSTAQLPQTSQVWNNIIIQAGNSAYGGIAMDPFYKAAGGDPPRVSSRDFTGAGFYDNLMWTSDRVHFDIAIAAGTKTWFGDNAYNGSGGAFLRNSTGQLRVSAGTGIIVSGMLKANVDGNDLKLRLIKITDPNVRNKTVFDRIVNLFNRDPRQPCPSRNIGAAVSAGFASGNIQGPYDDRLYSSCIFGGR